LDNCEHLLPACAHLVEVLLRSCPDLEVLATSREPLGVTGEVVWRVPPMALPRAPEGGGPGPTVDAADAVRLFGERARLQRPDFAVTPGNAATVAAICRRLDGIPLAIELAAARVGVLSIEHIAARLDDRFRLLTDGGRTALPRHQTLRAAMDWSNALLAEPERALFRRLSVFAGGFGLEAAEAVCGDAAAGDAAVLNPLTRLVLKSLVLVDEPGGDLRYRLLETVREYGREALVASGEAEATRRRHAAYYLALAEEWERRLFGAEQSGAGARPAGAPPHPPAAGER
jgi:predicted ATPase